MLQPESALLQLVEQLEGRVREKEAELADFERRAQEHIETLKEDLARNRKRIELFRTEMAAMTIESKPSKPFEFGTSIHAASVVQAEVDVDQESQSARIRAAAKVILADAGRPMMQSEIQSEMRSRNIHIVSKKLNELIRAALRRGREFKHVNGEGWTLNDVNSEG